MKAWEWNQTHWAKCWASKSPIQIIMKYYFIEFVGKAGFYFKKIDVNPGLTIDESIWARYGSTLSQWFRAKLRKLDYKIEEVSELKFKEQPKWEW